IGTVTMSCELRTRLQHVDRANVVECENAAGLARGFRDLANFRAGSLAPDEGNVLNARHGDVGDEHSAPMKMARVLFPQHACANPSLGAGVMSHHFSLIVYIPTVLYAGNSCQRTMASA